MSIFDVNFSTLWEQLTIPRLRKAKELAWGASLMKPQQELHDLIFTDYVQGSSYSIFSIGATYVPGDIAIYSNRSVYKNLVGSTGILPTDSTVWLKINDNYIGAIERSKYNSQKILYEYALNEWFQCIGIYIVNQTLSTGFFMMGETGEYSSTMSEGTNNKYFMGENYIGNSSFDYTIMVPSAVYSAIAPIPADADNIIRSFANMVNLAGMVYDIQTY